MIMKRLFSLFLLFFLISSISTIAYAYDGQVKDSNNIKFKDAAVKQLCVANWDTDGDGELSYDEAAAIKKLNDVFYSNNEISTFDELCFFTGLTNIPEEAFKDCRNLSSIHIPEGVTTIGESAFSWCTNLSSISIPNSVINIDSWAFSNTAWLDNKGDGIVYAGLVAYDYKGDMPDNTSISIKEGTIGIASLAFYGKSEITSVNIPMSITTIGKGAFHGCSNLTTVNLNCPHVGEWFSEITSIKTVNLGETVQDIEARAFNGCTGLISVNMPNQITVIGPKAFYHCSSLRSIRLPDNLQYIHVQAFAGCSSLESITLPERVLYIDDNAFVNCSSLQSINLPVGITRISQSLFKGCQKLNSIVIPESVTTIENFAFMNCKSLSSISIPKGVTLIGEDSFYGCNNLTQVSLYSQEPLAITINTFTNRENATLNIPLGRKAIYEVSDYWNEFKEIVEMKDDVTIGSSGYATYCSSHDLDFTDVSGLKAYIASGFEPSTGTLVLTRALKVPAGEGLYMVGDAGTYEVPFTTTDMVYSNLLKGVTTATTISPTDGGNTNFILANGSHGVGFYTLSAAGELAAGKAYLQLPSESVLNVKSISFVFKDDETAVKDLMLGSDIQEIYDIRGQIVSTPKKGLYIINGKKVFIK